MAKKLMYSANFVVFFDPASSKSEDEQAWERLKELVVNDCRDNITLEQFDVEEE